MIRITHGILRDANQHSAVVFKNWINVDTSEITIKGQEKKTNACKSQRECTFSRDFTRLDLVVVKYSPSNNDQGTTSFFLASMCLVQARV